MSTSEPPLDPQQTPSASLKSHQPNAPTERIDFDDPDSILKRQASDGIDEQATEPFALIDPDLVEENDESDINLPGSFNATTVAGETPGDDWRTISESNQSLNLDLQASSAGTTAEALDPSESEEDFEEDPLFERLNMLESRLEEARVEILGRFDQMRQMFEREVRAESNRERIVDRLHAELQEYKNDLLLKITRPIFIDLIQLHDDLGKLIDIELQRISESEPVDLNADWVGASDRVVKTLRDVMQSLEDTLYRQGVEPFVTEGDRFDPKRQRAVKTVPTNDPERSKTIATRIRPGFASGDRIIRPELVAVYAAR
ncbi:GrpE protein [Isosphaera pallida ATCC 43644]|uniref:Protein GrpE n=1 Tax=Isosphaera pallida (strain ATCC 43644 / DSM 9630 / IS1B) TaxID=575540 RepID=E8R420_ISOPI|nr:nucleotide exchange factor GrpE [Isosphaera pallida]ADV61607.1 GrpE protein [Isosphaera pallida ATCC 43644]